MVEVRPVGGESLGEMGTAAVTRRADIDFPLPGVPEPDHGLLSGGLDVRGSRAVASLAAHGDFGERCPIAPRGPVVRLDDTGGVAVRAHHVPVMARLGPMQDVVGREPGVLEVEPAATVGVPCHAERLQPSTGERQQDLLQRCGTECVAHVEVGGRTVGTGGADHVALTGAEERRADSGAVADLGGEVPGDAVGVGQRHRVPVMRVSPRAVLGLVTRGACGGADVCRVGIGVCRRRLATAGQSGGNRHQQRACRATRASCRPVRSAQFAPPWPSPASPEMLQASRDIPRAEDAVFSMHYVQARDRDRAWL